jgi:hypothetical protein
VSSFGPPSLGDVSAATLAHPIVGAASTPTGRGYWLVASDGGIFAFGDARFYGSPGGTHINKPIVAMAATPDGGGYWLVASDGGIFNYGDARFHGSPGATHLNAPIVAMAATPDGGGYWLVASDGGIFAYGDARFQGSTGSVRLNEPIVAMAATPDGGGYWLVASDGGIFGYGDARFQGSTGNRKLPGPIVAIAATPDGRGYWLAENNGTVFAFGDAPNLGPAAPAADSSPVVALLPALYQASSVPTTTTTSAPARSTTTTTWPKATTTTRPKTTTTTRPKTTTTTRPTATTVPPIPTTTVPASTSHPYPGGATGYDASWPQCYPPGSAKIQRLPANPAFAIVGVNSGYINGFNHCFAAEAKWAGPNFSVYIILQAAPGGDPKQESTGPKASCSRTSNLCEGYDWGYNYAEADLAFVRAKGRDPKVWWVDIETAERWPTSAPVRPINAAIIQGALDAIKKAGHVGGIYSTWYQWGKITGSYVPAGDPPIWVPGAYGVTGAEYGAQAYCQRAVLAGDPSRLSSSAIGFAGGVPWLVQYGYDGGTPRGVDPDYACS